MKKLLIILLFPTTLLAGWEVNNTNSKSFTATVGTPCSDNIIYSEGGIDYRGVDFNGYTAAFECTFVQTPPPPPTGQGYLYDQLNTLTSGQSKAVTVNGPQPTGQVLDFAIKGSAACNGEFHFIGQPHDASVSHHYKFDIVNNTWVDLGTPPVVVGHGYDGVVVDPVTCDIYAIPYYSNGSITVHKYNGSWSTIPTLNHPYASWIDVEYFPNKGVVINPPYEDYIFIFENGLWSSYSKPFYSSAYHVGSSYDPIVDVVYFGGGDQNPQPHNSIDRNGNIVSLSPIPTYGPQHGALIQSTVYTDATKIYFDLGPGVFYIDKNGGAWVRKK